MTLTETNARLLLDLNRDLFAAMPTSLKSPSFGNVEARAFDAEVAATALTDAGAAIARFLAGWVGELDADIGALTNRPRLMKDFAKEPFGVVFDEVVDELRDFARSTEDALQTEAVE